MSESKPSAKYGDFTITYSEVRDMWECPEILSRGWQTLTFAKEAIDRVLAKRTNPKKEFARFDVWYNGWGFSNHGRYIKVTVTSITDEGEPWLAHGKTRQKGSRGYKLVRVNPHNDAIIAEIHKLQDEKDALTTKITETERKLKYDEPTN